jgi:DNA-binding GntR family transcriptional regulator
MRVRAVAEAITTRPPSPAEASWLALAPGAALLRIVRLAVSPAGRPLEINETRMSGDEFEIRYPLTGHSASPLAWAACLMRAVCC